VKIQDSNQIQKQSDLQARRRTVLVVGATGQQGGAVARLLSKRGHTVRALTRNPDSASSLALQNLGVTVMKGELNDSESVQRASKGVDAAFVMSTPMKEAGGIMKDGGLDAEIHEAINAIEAVQTAGVKHLIYSSVASADENTGIPHFDSKYKVEEYIRQNVKIPYTIVAPATFMENYSSPPLSGAIAQGKLVMPLPSSRKLQHVALNDFAGVVAKILESPLESFSGKRIEVASDELSLSEVAKTLTEVLGRSVEYNELPLQIARSAIGDDLAKMFEWFSTTGYSVNISELKDKNPEVDWHNFREWARSHDWHNLLTVKSNA
jgi:uncharacterized protein YbjT (DUF2867 family)